MNKLLGLVGIAAVLAVAAALGTGATRAAAEDDAYRCDNQTLTGLTITGNIVVPPTAFCDLGNSHVTGSATVANTGGLSLDGASSIGKDVHLSRNATFALFNGSSVGGDVKCDECAYAFSFSGSAVDGNFQEEGASQGAIIDNSSIGGSLDIHSSHDTTDTPAYDIENNVIGANLTFDNNTGSSDFLNNAITNNFSCHGNSPPPAGAGNTAAHKHGQCANL